MRSALRYTATAVAAILGSGFLSPLIQANWQKWAEQTGNDQYLIKYAEPIMSWLREFSDSGWFIFAFGFFTGGAIFLWANYFLPGKSKIIVPNDVFDETKLALISGKFFKNQRIVLDGNRYINCTFENVTFVYNGSPFVLRDSSISGAFISSDRPELNAYAKIMFDLGFLKVPAVGDFGPLKPTSPIINQIEK